jgi:uncharacterized protein YjbI with pentapeptide repeats
MRKIRHISFRGKDLTGEDFSNADIRGVNFNNSVLVNANFRYAKAGHRWYWQVALSFSVLLIAFLSGLLTGFGCSQISGLMFYTESQPVGFWSGLATFAILVSFIFISLKKGLGSALGGVSVLTALTVGLIVFSGQGRGIGALVIQSCGLAISIAGMFASSISMAITVRVNSRFTNVVTIVIASILYLLGGFLGIYEGLKGKIDQLDFHLAGIFTLILLFCSLYVGWQAVKGHTNYFLVNSIATFISSKGATSFRGANLTDADFAEASLKNADFRKATLIRTNWYLVKQLEQARCDRTYLEDPQIRQLAITKDGQGKHFEHLDLSGLNLKDANLKDAFFIGADLNEATLENANLTGARLIKTQLYQANLSGTRLTGAYIENWGISTQTNLNNVQCDYIFMQLPTDADPDPCRKPDNKKENFKEGDFADFIAPIIKTLDLYHTQNLDLREVGIKFKTLDLFHNEGIDPSAAAIAIKQLIEQHPEAELEVISLEGRGNEKIRLQAKVAGDTNRSELNAEYFAKYQQIKSLPYSDMQSLLTGIEEKDERIRGLEKLLENAISQPKFYVETYHNQGEFIMAQENKGNVNISGVQGNISGIAAAGENQTMTGVALGAISGNVTNTISQLPDTTDPNEPSLKELLTQLQALIESESELNEEDKVEALEQVKVLAESGQKPEDSTLQKLAKTAVKILKGTIASLPDVTKLVESGAKLLPYITKLLGLP